MTTDAVLQTPTRSPERLTLITRDGYPITALRHVPPGPARGRLIVAGATGVPQGFYRRFAEFMTEHGLDTLTLDYRGVGLSAPRTLKGFRMDYLDWARQDLAAAVEAMADDTSPLYMVGHSYGGHAFGLLPNHQKIQAFYTFATGAGWHGWMPRAEQVRVLLMWRVVGPLLAWWKGYLAWSYLGMGEDLPLDVFRQWGHWCRFPRYFFDDPAMPGLKAQFEGVRTPIVAANAVDDVWAPPASRDAFMAGYSRAPVRTVTLLPQDFGLRSIGHMGYFRPQAQPLWVRVLEWFESRDPAASPPRCLPSAAV
jgi:predicted alpha/beta hydrolase